MAVSFGVFLRMDDTRTTQCCSVNGICSWFNNAPILGALVSCAALPKVYPDVTNQYQYPPRNHALGSFKRSKIYDHLSRGAPDQSCNCNYTTVPSGKLYTHVCRMAHPRHPLILTRLSLMCPSTLTHDHITLNVALPCTHHPCLARWLPSPRSYRTF